MILLFRSCFLTLESFEKLIRKKSKSLVGGCGMPGMCGIAEECQQCRTLRPRGSTFHPPPASCPTPSDPPNARAVIARRTYIDVPPTCNAASILASGYSAAQCTTRYLDFFGTAPAISSIWRPIFSHALIVWFYEKLTFRVLTPFFFCRCECEILSPRRIGPRWRPCKGFTWAVTPCPSASTTPTRPWWGPTPTSPRSGRAPWTSRPCPPPSSTWWVVYSEIKQPSCILAAIINDISE